MRTLRVRAIILSSTGTLTYSKATISKLDSSLLEHVLVCLDRSRSRASVSNAYVITRRKSAHCNSPRVRAIVGSVELVARCRGMSQEIVVLCHCISTTLRIRRWISYRRSAREESWSYASRSRFGVASSYEVFCLCCVSASSSADMLPCHPYHPYMLSYCLGCLRIS